MHLYLKYGWLDSSKAEHLANHSGADIAESNVAHKAFSHEFFHGLPSLLVRNSSVQNHSVFASIDLLVKVNPLRRVFALDRHELQSDREVNEVKVEVVNTHVSHCLLARKLDILRTVESVPKFGNHEQVFSFANTFVKGSLDALSCHHFVAIVSSRVEQSISVLDGIVHLISTDVLGHFPKTEAYLRHSVT